jgi:TolB-like protein
MKPVPIAVLLSVTTLATAAGAEEAPPADGCRIVVLNLLGRGLDARESDLPAILTESLAGEVEAVSGCSVVSQADILAMLDFERQKAVCTDGSDSCLAEVGQALGAERVVAGTVGKLGSEYVLTVRLMNVRKGVVEQRVEEAVSGAPSRLRHTAKNAGRRLFGADELEPGALAEGGSPSAGWSALVWTGAILGGAGALAVVGGGLVAGLAELRLADPAERKKDAARDQGHIGLFVAGVGAAAVAAGGLLMLVGGE